MGAFEFLSVALSFVLGLAVTLLLTSILTAFRARRTTKMDWLPFAWAGLVLVYQFQYWWAIYELAALPEWTVWTFGLVLLLAMLLFMAGGLILPAGPGKYPTDLNEYFQEDGKWGVAGLAGYYGAGLVGNYVLFGTPLADPLITLQLITGLLAVGFLITKRRSHQIGLTLVFAILTAIGVVWATPVSYS